MAVHRTKIQKQQAAQKRKLEYRLYSGTTIDLADLTANQSMQPLAQSSHENSKSDVKKPLESGLSHHMAMTAAYLVQDLRKTFLVSLVLCVLLIGIWILTRYNGLSRIM